MASGEGMSAVALFRHGGVFRGILASVGSFKGNIGMSEGAIFKDFYRLFFLFVCCFSMNFLCFSSFSFPIGNPGILASL